MNTRIHNKAMILMAAAIIIAAASTRLKADTGMCGGVSTTLPFTDVLGSSTFFCSIAEAYVAGLTNGTTPTTYRPNDPVPREQMAAFVTRTMDQSLKRGSRRAALKQFWTPTSENGFGLTTVGSSPGIVESDGADLWVASGNTVSRVRASDGKLLETWTGAIGAGSIVAAKGRIFVTGHTSPGRLYEIDPTQPAGVVTTLSSSAGGFPDGISFDGDRIWTANEGGSVSIITLNPVTVTIITAGFNNPIGILYDGANMWVTDLGLSNNSLFKLDSNGAIIQTVPVGIQPGFPVFDGTNIWVPSFGSNSVTVVRASTGVIIATLAGNGLSGASGAAFDGERVLVTSSGNRVSLWKATDLSPLGFVSTGAGSTPLGACSDGLNFWVTFSGSNKLARL
jgi:hypothetical protein